MQLHFDADELNVLAEILLEKVGRISAQEISAANGDIRQAARRYDDLLDKVFAGNMRLDRDELEQVADLLAQGERDLKDKIVRLQNSASRLRLQQRLGLVECVLERLEEARAMF